MNIEFIGPASLADNKDVIYPAKLDGNSAATDFTALVMQMGVSRLRFDNFSLTRRFAEKHDMSFFMINPDYGVI